MCRWWSEMVWGIQSVIGFLVDWWQRDRIRISPTTGRLLSLRKGHRILLLERLFDVQAVQTLGPDDLIVYTLNSDGESATLKIKRDDDGRALEAWLDWFGHCEPVFDDDVVVLSPFS